MRGNRVFSEVEEIGEAEFYLAIQIFDGDARQRTCYILDCCSKNT